MEPKPGQIWHLRFWTGPKTVRILSVDGGRIHWEPVEDDRRIGTMSARRLRWFYRYCDGCTRSAR